MPTDPVNIEVVKRIHEGALGRLMHVDSLGFSSVWPDPGRPHAREPAAPRQLAHHHPAVRRFHRRIQRPHDQRRAVGGRQTPGPGQRPDPPLPPRRAWRRPRPLSGHLRVRRRAGLDPPLPGAAQRPGRIIRCEVYGDNAYAHINYWGNSFLRGGPKQYGGGPVDSLYDQGAKRNIATFYQNIIGGICDNPTPQQAGDDALTGILGREAAPPEAAHHGRPDRREPGAAARPRRAQGLIAAQSRSNKHTPADRGRSALTL